MTIITQEMRCANTYVITCMLRMCPVASSNAQASRHVEVVRIVKPIVTVMCTFMYTYEIAHMRGQVAIIASRYFH
jgi:heme/copper-type cytochrome/quinol oxidase subunit 2